MALFTAPGPHGLPVDAVRRSGGAWRLGCLALALALTACGDSDDDDDDTPVDAALSCGSEVMELDLGDANAEITAVTAFAAGDPLPGTDMTAPVDTCLVELTVGPGNPGPEDAPSTSKGIGIEVWLPDHAAWNGRVEALGGGGWAGIAAIIDPTVVGSPSRVLAAVAQGAVASFTDTGHSVEEGDFAMNPDGSINWTLWEDFAERGVYEQTVKSQAIAQAYFADEVQYSYWNGCSTGGRQGLMMAQRHPELFDGILSAAPAINWDRFIPAELWPQIVVEQDLGGVPLSSPQLATVTAAAVNACEEVPGQGYINNPADCRYDPTTDSAMLCVADGGANATETCLTLVQAQAVNKIWYGPTYDGSVPDPQSDNGYNLVRPANQLWYGLTRGTDLFALGGRPFGGNPFPIGTDMAALSLEDPRYGAPNFDNAVSDGQDLWKEIGYGGAVPLYYLFDRSQALYGSVIGTDDPDLSEFRDRGGKLLMWHGLSDVLIFPQGTVHYYERVMDRLGGLSDTQEFARLYLLPGVGHCSGPGTTGGNPAYPDGEASPNTAFIELLRGWVEQGEVPMTLSAETAEGTTPVRTRPVCLYPETLTYTGGDPDLASSFACQ